MTSAELLYEISFIAQIAVNVIVAYYVFPAWQKLRHRFLLILGISALIGVFTGVSTRLLERMPMQPAEYYVIWNANAILGIADLVLYALGLVGMVRHLQASLSQGDRAAFHRVVTTPKWPAFRRAARHECFSPQRSERKRTRLPLAACAATPPCVAIIDMSVSRPLIHARG